MALGLVVMAVGSLIFLPAAPPALTGCSLQGFSFKAQDYPYFKPLPILMLPYLDPLRALQKELVSWEFATRWRDSWDQLVLGAIILKNFEAIDVKIKAATVLADKETLLDNLAQRAVLPYIIMSIVLLALSFFVRYSPLPEIELENESGEKDAVFG